MKIETYETNNLNPPKGISEQYSRFVTTGSDFKETIINLAYNKRFNSH